MHVQIVAIVQHHQVVKELGGQAVDVPRRSATSRRGRVPRRGRGAAAVDLRQATECGRRLGPSSVACRRGWPPCGARRRRRLGGGQGLDGGVDGRGASSPQHGSQPANTPHRQPPLATQPRAGPSLTATSTLRKPRRYLVTPLERRGSAHARAPSEYERL